MSAKKIQDHTFFTQSAAEVAQELLGKLLCRRMDDGFVLRCRIVETEAYSGEEVFCYGYGGKKPQNKEAVFYSVGKGCVYADMLMLSCLDQDTPDNVLIRRLDGYQGPQMSASALDATSALNDTDVTASDILWLEDDGAKVEYTASQRVNIPDEKPWNFAVTAIAWA